MKQSPDITKQRLPEYAKDDEWIRSFLAQVEVGHIATHWEEQPFITSSIFFYDVEKHSVFFHSNVVGRIRSNSEEYLEVCFEASRYGRFLPSNIALEFSMQYESVIAFGKIRVVEDHEEKRVALYAMLKKYFADKKAGRDYRPITEKELRRTSVYKIEIERWSGKRNWEEEAEKSDDWQPESLG